MTTGGEHEIDTSAVVPRSCPGCGISPVVVWVSEDVEPTVKYEHSPTCSTHRHRMAAEHRAQMARFRKDFPQ